MIAMQDAMQDAADQGSPRLPLTTAEVVGFMESEKTFGKPKFWIAFDELILDPELDVRDAPNMGVVREYTVSIEDGNYMEPIEVHLYKGRLFVIDGRHRFTAYKQVKEYRGALCRITELKTDQDAMIIKAAEANVRHGLRLTPSEKQKAVRMILNTKMGAQRGDASIAKAMMMDRHDVAKLRKALGAESDKRKGEDGKTYTKPRRKPKPTTPTKPQQPYLDCLSEAAEALDRAIHMRVECNVSDKLNQRARRHQKNIVALIVDVQKEAKS